MAPLDPRQYHSFSPSTPGYGKETPGKPVPVNTFIDPTVFVELFTGTVGIFIFAVLFWKLGKFFRSLTRHRVLCEGKLMTTRYARTWYGWVPLKTHERNKAFIRKIFRYVREWFSWESPRTDYQWMWRDPGLEAMEARRAKRKRIKLLPECLKSYEEMPAAHIPYPRSSIECHGALGGIQDAEPSRPIRLGPEWDDIAEPLPRISFNEHRFENSTASSISLEMFTPQSRAHTRSTDDRAEGGLRVDGRTIGQLLALPTNVHSLPISTNSRRAPRKMPSWAEENTLHMRRVSRLSFVRNSSDVAEVSPGPSVHQSIQRSMEAPKPVFRRGDIVSRKYRAWSAQMQAKATGLAQPHLQGSSGPPGTPLTALLASYLSEQSACDTYPDTPKEVPLGANSSFTKITLATSRDPLDRGKRGKHATSFDVDSKNSKFNTAPARFRPSKKPPLLTAHTSNQLSHSWQDTNTTALHKTSLQATCAQPAMARSRARARATARNRYATLPSCMDGCMDGVSEGEQISVAKLSDWEVRLIDHLNRKLGWIHNEMTPGQKPYHFALLANHWLNRETWLVIDPISRVPIHQRRQWGDPRFSPTDAENDPVPRLKYPATARKRAQVPRIDSWRAAVNKQRRVSGNRIGIRTIELYEDSAEEPPDGHIDPACWILPKPPQGFEMSTRQKNAWYEGGAGWQEKLEDWRQVRRGYRLQKFVHEGRVNRNRVKELASQVSKVLPYSAAQAPS
ncbi:uncharacterized protein N7496_002846 [Penicillium cataractarum]|uniref:Uncharacterized protein n=1 Tax=Penicillium cataractarum TaxID=2100454 RepID=A0A9W9SKV2_9EURO|nr:uncharacterized protein N7496_002846 [Penicillium cataractarum]KAJ5380418.1 hypothetical protein N7496_002846 [Penicillium cataractarum]